MLGIDPGLANTGWAVIDINDAGEFLVDCGVERTSKGRIALAKTRCEDDMERLDVLVKGVVQAVQKHSVDIAAVEGRAGSRNARAAEAMSLSFASIMTSLYLVGVSRIVVSPQKVKKLVADHIKGNVSPKGPIMEEVRYRLGPSVFDEKLEGFPKRSHEHIYDAAGVALASLNHPAIMFIRRREMQASGTDEETKSVREAVNLGGLHNSGVGREGGGVF